VTALPLAAPLRSRNTPGAGHLGPRGSLLPPSLVAALLALVAILTATSRATPTAAAMPSTDPRSVADLPDRPAFRLDSTRKGQIARCLFTSAHPCFAHLPPAPRRR